MKRIMFVLITVSLLFSMTGYAQDTYQLVLTWGSNGIGDGQFLNANGVAVDSHGNVYVADCGNNRIQKFDSNGIFLEKWGTPGGVAGAGDGEFNGPYDVAVDADGFVYVIDTWNYRIQKFDSNGEFITKWAGSFGAAISIAAYFDGYANYIYVADANGCLITKFDSVGNVISQFGGGVWGGHDDGQVYHPEDLAVDSHGYVYVADTWNHRIQKFDSNGIFLAKWGTPGGVAGAGDGDFNCPNAVTVDSDGFVFVSDYFNLRIQKFDSNGNFITKWDNYFPQGLTVDSDGYVYVAAPGTIEDTNHHQIQKYAPPFMLGPANMWIGLKNNDDVGTKFDLFAEVLKNDVVVGSGELDDVNGGSSGFNKAVKRTIDLALWGSPTILLGDTLSFRLSVRISATSGHRSGTARLWFNDMQAKSSFYTTIGGVNKNYYLLSGFGLGVSAGLGPKKYIDVFVDRLKGGNPFKPFGTWSKTF